MFFYFSFHQAEYLFSFCKGCKVDVANFHSWCHIKYNIEFWIQTKVMIKQITTYKKLILNSTSHLNNLVTFPSITRSSLYSSIQALRFIQWLHSTSKMISGRDENNIKISFNFHPLTQNQTTSRKYTKKCIKFVLYVLCIY